MSTSSQEQLMDLLAVQATQGLSDSEAQQLQTLLHAHPQLQADEFDAAVAAIFLVGDHATPLPMPLPKVLQEKILQAAPKVIALPVRKPQWREHAGWWSAAACLLLAIAGWWPRLAGDSAMHETVVAQLTPAQQRALLLQNAQVIQASWSPGSDAAGQALQGDVVFDPTQQRGYLRFRGIPANDPRLEQYQLWIADAARQPPEPVDAGIFNTPQTTAEGDVIIPFTAKLPVGKPAAFVITVERPGGVVVSKQERVLALAKVTTRF